MLPNRFAQKPSCAKGPRADGPEPLLTIVPDWHYGRIELYSAAAVRRTIAYMREPIPVVYEVVFRESLRFRVIGPGFTLPARFLPDLERGGHGGGPLRLLGGDIALLAGIGHEIEQFPGLARIGRV